MLMDIILIQTEIHIKMICLWRSPPDTQSVKVKSFSEVELSWRRERKKKEEGQDELSFM